MRLHLSILAVFYMMLISIACHSIKKSTSVPNIDQGIRGQVLEVKGNQMPSPDAPPSKGHGVNTEVYVFEPTNIKEVERINGTSEYKAIHRKIIKTVKTDSAGRFAVDLPPGTYSLFIRLNGHYYSNLFDVDNNIGIVTVEPNRVSQVNITISSKATY